MLRPRRSDPLAQSVQSARRARPPARALALGAIVAAAASAGCAGTLSAPFGDLRASDMTVYRLQNFEPPTQAAASPTQGAFPIPPQIQQWIQAGASLLPPGLLPPGLLPGTAAVAPAPDAPRFHGFRILDWRQVTDASVKGDIVDTFGHASNFHDPQFNCMYAELGFAIAQPNGQQPADVLVSLSCQQVQAYNFAWPYPQTGITPDTEKRLAQVAQKVFAGH